jgi:hypothetical protein
MGIQVLAKRFMETSRDKRRSRSEGNTAAHRMPAFEQDAAIGSNCQERIA